MSSRKRLLTSSTLLAQSNLIGSCSAALGCNGPLAARLNRAAQARYLLLKLGPRGALGFAEGESEAAGEDRSFALGSYASVVVDPVGAGDAFLAYAVLSLLARPGCLATAAILGSFAAGAECEYDGNIPVTPERIMAKIDQAEREVS